MDVVCRPLVHSCGRPGALVCLLLGDRGLQAFSEGAEPKVCREWGTGFQQDPWKRDMEGGRERSYNAVNAYNESSP